jgi:hypothetical protein
MTLAVERRGSVRHETVNNQTSVQLMDDRTGKRITRAKLLNISTGGALILTDKEPALYQPLRVRFENATEIALIDAEPVRFGRSKEVAIRFTRQCPSDFLFMLGVDSPRVARTRDPIRG